MDYFERIQATIDYIECNLRSDISLKQLSTIACFSEFHFHRVFHILTGETVMDYIRKRRLTEAADELLKTRRKIIEIAYDYQFNSPDSFTRAFRRFTGLNPGEFRRTMHVNYGKQEKLVLSSLMTFNNFRRLIMEPLIITKKSFKLAGYELRTTMVDDVNFREIPEFWDYYMDNNLRGKIPGKKNMEIEYGTCCNFDSATKKFSYIIGFETDASVIKVPEDMVLITVPSSRYAVFTTPKVKRDGFLKAIQDTTKFIYSEWLPKSGYEYNCSGFDLEIYDRRCDCSNEFSQMDICIPVK